MSTNKVSAVLTDEDKTAVLEALAQVKEKMPFLINLTGKERHRTRKMGAKSVEYVNLSLQSSRTFGVLMPPSIDISEFAKDVTLINQLLAIRMELGALLEGIDDTMTAAGADAMHFSDLVYSYLKTGARTNAGVKGITAEIAKRFGRRNKISEVLKA